MIYSLPFITTFYTKQFRNYYEKPEIFFGIKRFIVQRNDTQSQNVFINMDKEQKIYVRNILDFYNNLVEINDYYLIEKFREIMKTTIKIKNIYTQLYLEIICGKNPVLKNCESINIQNFIYNVNLFEKELIQIIIKLVSDKKNGNNNFCNIFFPNFKEITKNIQEIKNNVIDGYNKITKKYPFVIEQIPVYNSIPKVFDNYIQKKIGIDNIENYLKEQFNDLNEYLSKNTFTISNNPKIKFNNFLRIEDCLNYFISCILYDYENSKDEKDSKRYYDFVKTILINNGNDVDNIYNKIIKNDNMLSNFYDVNYLFFDKV